MEWLDAICSNVGMNALDIGVAIQGGIFVPLLIAMILPLLAILLTAFVTKVAYKKNFWTLFGVAVFMTVVSFVGFSVIFALWSSASELILTLTT